MFLAIAPKYGHVMDLRKTLESSAITGKFLKLYLKECFTDQLSLTNITIFHLLQWVSLCRRLLNCIVFLLVYGFAFGFVNTASQYTPFHISVYFSSFDDVEQLLDIFDC